MRGNAPLYRNAYSSKLVHGISSKTTRIYHGITFDGMANFILRHISNILFYFALFKTRLATTGSCVAFVSWYYTDFAIPQHKHQSAVCQADN
jgi:hypothetical protein